MYAIVRELNIKPAFKEENQRRVTDELLPKVREIRDTSTFISSTRARRRKSPSACSEIRRAARNWAAWRMRL